MLISPEDFTSQGLFEVYHDAEIKVDMDDDGYVRIVYDGVRLRANVESERNLLSITCWRDLKRGVDRAKVLEFCNRVNDRLVMIRCCCPERPTPSSIYFDHFVLTDGGISAEEILKVTNRFVRVVSSVGDYDFDDVLDQTTGDLTGR